MVVTNIIPCLKITKEDNMTGVDMYLEIGTKIKLVDDNGTTVEGTILSFELSQYDEQDDMLHLMVNNQEYYSIGVTHVVDIEEL
ncbi:hypothetical protein [Streptococcus gallolyticus]|uniref:hypothetical protein n=1 Tax=Streptococcus gallolyticus TaxID=315405 RepID=UPI0007354DA2|nr:hypothetical protein [Streptococcus gallolyticus]KUE92325.1 hypothetical protein AU078_04850 [Streptococcus gallolyticus]